MTVRNPHWITATPLLAAGAMSALPASPARAQTLSVLYNFGANPGDPMYPREIGALVEGKDGAIYGTSERGGASGRGTVFKVMPDGKMTVLRSFDGVEGGAPWGGLSPGGDGNFYGSTYAGGKLKVGTLYRIAPDGAFKVLYDFRNKDDGSYPTSPPVLGRDGNLYGVTSSSANQQYGTIYRLSPDGTFTALFRFKPADAATLGTLGSRLIAGSDGNLYGTTLKGGRGHGTVFKATPQGAVTALHTFDGAHGALSYNLMQASDGNLYGTCFAGGPSGSGVVYRLTPGGAYTVLHAFSGPDGAAPMAGLVEAKDGYLYGATKFGGAGTRGVIYRLKPSGEAFSVVYSRDARMTEGLYCLQTPIQHSNGKLYGDTSQGGGKGGGVFYSLDMTLFALTPASGRVGGSVTLNGFNFTGATSVSFNGKAAPFKVESDTRIRATVPTGAASGTVTVTTPQGTLTSKAPFQVRP